MALHCLARMVLSPGRWVVLSFVLLPVLSTHAEASAAILSFEACLALNRGCYTAEIGCTVRRMSSLARSMP